VSETLRRLAELLRKLPAELDSDPFKHLVWCEERGARYILDAMKSGALSGPEWIELRHEIEHRAGNAATPDYTNVFYGPFSWACDRGRQADFGIDQLPPDFRACCLVAAEIVERSIPDLVQAITPTKAKAIKPTDIAIQAWRLHFTTGRPQAEIAEVLRQQTGRSVTQGQVSRG
jgi:hypothetical protein